MIKLPIVDSVLKYLYEDNAPFSMPGHKHARGFFTTQKGKLLYENLIRADITEVEGLDNLHKPEGSIKEAEELLKEFYGSYKSYFLVNGSTSGNLAMIFATFNEGDKIIVERNCHRSIFNAIIMRKLKPIYIKNVINDKYDAPFSIDMEHFFKLLNQNPDAKGIVITYPNYYGICADLYTIIKASKEKGIAVLVDSAHGAHFGVSNMLPKSAVELGADMVVMSAHKTLPSLTQTAYLHISDNVNKEMVEFYVSAFTSTSPSYVLLSSLDYARYFLQVQGKIAFEDCINLAEKYRKLINEVLGFHVISDEDLIEENNNIIIDKSRFVVNVGKNYSGHKLLKYLRDCGVQAELSDSQNVVLILSPFNTEEDLERLYHSIKNCSMDKLYCEQSEIKISDIPETILLPHEVMDKQYEEIFIYDAQERISATSIVPYPPGVPVIMPGEKLDEDTINVIQYYLKNNITVLGVSENKIKVIKI